MPDVPSRRKAVLLLAISLAWAQGAGFAAEGLRPVRVQKVAVTDSLHSEIFSGSVQARTLADLGFRVGGKVVERPVEIGDHVRAGQVLARIDQADLSLARDADASAMRAAEAEAASARSELARYVRLGRGSAAYLASEYDRRVFAERNASARLEQAKRRLSMAGDQLAYGMLTADADGVITSLTMQVGQVVAAGQTVAQLAHTDATEVVTDVPEDRLDLVRHASVRVALWSDPDHPIAGKVREIGALADPASRTFAVKISLIDPPRDAIALGMTAAVTFSVPAGKQTMVVPGTALVDRDGAPSVWVYDPDRHRATQRAVTIAAYHADGAVAVGAGLRRDDLVVTAGASELTPDLPVTAWEGAVR